MIPAEHNAEANGGGTTPAIAVFVFGRKEYAYAAQHLAMTLGEHSPGVPIHLWIEVGLPYDESLFTEVHTLEAKYYADGPGALKLNVHDILPEGDWLYVDADMLNISDLRPSLELLKAHDFALDLKGAGGEQANIPYTPWATQATIKRVNDFSSGLTYYGVQTSWMWISKGSKLCADIFARAKACKYVPEDLKERWGTSIPDELCISTALTALEHTPFSLPLSFYGADATYAKFQDVTANHQFACLYGDRKKHRLVRTTWFDIYDRMIRNLYQRKKRPMGMDLFSIMRGKYISQ